MSDAHGTPLIVILSGPSGVGKDAILERMAELDYPHHFVVTATSRPPRTGERDGVNHHFLTRPQFRQMIEHGEFLEWAEVYGNLYGVPRRQVADALARGRHVMIRVDVQGAARIRQLVPDALLVFILPPDLETLHRRLVARGLDPADAIAARGDIAVHEMWESEKFDYTVVNEDDALDEAVREVIEIIEAESRRDPPRAFDL